MIPDGEHCPPGSGCTECRPAGIDSPAAIAAKLESGELQRGTRAARLAAAEIAGRIIESAFEDGDEDHLKGARTGEPGTLIDRMLSDHKRQMQDDEDPALDCAEDESPMIERRPVSNATRAALGDGLRSGRAIQSDASRTPLVVPVEYARAGHLPSQERDAVTDALATAATRLRDAELELEAARKHYGEALQAFNRHVAPVVRP